MPKSIKEKIISKWPVGFRVHPISYNVRVTWRVEYISDTECGSRYVAQVINFSDPKIQERFPSLYLAVRAALPCLEALENVACILDEEKDEKEKKNAKRGRKRNPGNRGK